jgi:hypothetical protein
MRLMGGSSIEVLAMFIAAFGVVALVVIFAHPSSQPVARAIGNDAAATAAAFKPAGEPRLRRGAFE